MRPAAGVFLLVIAFGILVTANSAGYRYGISDQALYLPAFELARTPELFPRDRQLIERQARLMVVDEAVAVVTAITGLTLPVLAFAGYTISIVLYAAGAVLIGTRLYRSTWAVAALALALTLRHRISGSGVNTFEGYFHPRVLAFAVGLLAVAALWRGRWAVASGLAAGALLVHPTAGAAFVIWVGVAWVVERPSAARLLAGGAAAGTAAAALLAAGWRSGRLVVMDAAWRSAFADRDYLFPTADWSAGDWLVNLLAPALVASAVLWRTRLRLVTRTEAGVAAGALALLGVFAASLPFVASHVALAVQLQTSRLLWPLEWLGTAYLVWILAEAPWAAATRRRQVALVALLAIASAARGVYVLRVEHSHPLVAVRPEASDWTRMGEWIAARTPVDAHILAEPRHVWPYGTSVRIAARRDVLTEDVKDAAVAIYGRDVALRVVERRQALGNFHRLTERDFHALDRRYDLDYLIVDRPLNLPVAHREGDLTLYPLRPTGEPPDQPD